MTFSFEADFVPGHLTVNMKLLGTNVTNIWVQIIITLKIGKLTYIRYQYQSTPSSISIQSSVKCTFHGVFKTSLVNILESSRRKLFWQIRGIENFARIKSCFCEWRYNISQYLSDLRVSAIETGDDEFA